MTAVGSTSRELAWRPVDGSEIEMRHVGALQAEVEPKIDPYVELAPEREEIRRKLAEFHPPNDDEIAETARSRSMKTAWIAGLSVTGFFGLAGAVAVPALTKAKGFGPIAAAVAGGLIVGGLIGSAAFVPIMSYARNRPLGDHPEHELGTTKDRWLTEQGAGELVDRLNTIDLKLWHVEHGAATRGSLESWLALEAWDPATSTVADEVAAFGSRFDHDGDGSIDLSDTSSERMRDSRGGPVTSTSREIEHLPERLEQRGDENGDGFLTPDEVIRSMVEQVLRDRDDE